MSAADSPERSPQPNHSIRRLLHFLWFVFSPLLLLILPQAIYVKRTTLRLPEAEAMDKAPANPNAFQLVHIGESTVAGVGVQTLDQGFTANIASQLESHTSQAVQWHTLGVNGIRLKALIEQAKSQGIPKANMVMVTMGVNDTTGFTQIKRWQSQLIELIEWLKPHCTGPIIFTQVPPMMKFPALPAPLRYFIGLRALVIDAYLQKVCGHFEGVFYVGVEPNFETELMAEDGYHPSAKGYQEWSRAITPELNKILDQYKAESSSVD